MHAHQWRSQPAESSTKPESNDHRLADLPAVVMSYTANLIDGAGSTGHDR